MRSAITPMGKKWEYLHSFWMLWLLFPFGFSSFISFFYIGVRVRKLKWIIAGFIYLLLVVQFFIIDEHYPQEHYIFDLSVFLVLIGWIAAWVNAVLSRRTYLQLLAAKTKAEVLGSYEMEDTTTVGSFSNPYPSTDSTEMAVQAEDDSQIPPSNKVNMNIAMKEEIETIPSVEDILAEQIVEIRRRRGPFRDFAHFFELMDKKLILAEARPYMIFSNEETEEETKQTTESNKYSTGRNHSI
ncbi:helix-hairpin-helix domain-containing protein [Oceanobacillus sp. J11TS1]|uniref:ComEA family DNA-binding protein n=1 Tax=Oceanobacillus sp. J11TS1 TaxID=2807191 RepID=UPI001B24FB78|nr:helix-hairpin-helix domain-containing protein [Oceanobacillus sp. J11TS1]GIO22147.1 hypothetical protein J11TS1_07280 [Oceanobacillus sp. J11TS1]